MDQANRHKHHALAFLAVPSVRYDNRKCRARIYHGDTGASATPVNVRKNRTPPSRNQIIIGSAAHLLSPLPLLSG
jgi:hypothetical protein